MNFKIVSGFSLVEVMVAMGLLGASALTFMQIQKNNITANKKTETRYDVNNLAQDINSVLIDGGACLNTFRNRNFITNPVAQFSAIRDGSTAPGQTVYGTGDLIPNSVNVERYEYAITTAPIPSPSGESIGEFEISFFYREGSAILRNSNLYQKKIDNKFKVVTDPSGLITNCFSDAGTNITENVKTACEAVGGYYETSDLKCYLNRDSTNNRVRSFVNAQIGEISNADVSEGISSEDFVNMIVPDLLDRNFLATKSDGVLEGEVVMGGRLILGQAPTSDNNAVNLQYYSRIECPVGELGVVVGGTSVTRCSRLLCNNSGDASQQYFAGIDASGAPICRNLIENSSEACEHGGALRAVNGSVRFECCTPECGHSANFCSGVQIPSENGCGTCQGTRPIQNNEWTAWTDAGQFREAGACVGGIVQMEKLQTRSCQNGNDCGVNNCTGNDSQWVSSGTRSCGTAVVKRCAYDRGEGDYYPQNATTLSQSCSNAQPSSTNWVGLGQTYGATCEKDSDCLEDRRTNEGAKWFCSPSNNVNNFTELTSCRSLGPDYAKICPWHTQPSACSGRCTHFEERDFIGCVEAPAQACVPNWPRDTSASTCVGHCVRQTDGCGNTRVIRGTSTATSPQCMQNANGPGADCDNTACTLSPADYAMQNDLCSGSCITRLDSCGTPHRLCGSIDCSGGPGSGHGIGNNPGGGTNGL